MIGIVVVTHCNLGTALIESAEFINGTKSEAVTSVSVNAKNDADSHRKSISDAVKKVDNGSGVIILTDMFGGTPSNLSYSFLDEGKIEVISGVNLPVLVRAIGLQKQSDLSKVADILVATGKKSISLASGILKGNGRSEE